MEDVSFYSTVAQVLPVFLLAAAIESGFLENLRPFDESIPRWVGIVDAVALPLGVVVIVAGELAALDVVIGGHVGKLEHLIVVWALLAGAFGVTTPILNKVTIATMASLNPYGVRWTNFAKLIGTVTIRVVIVALGALVMVALLETLGVDMPFVAQPLTTG
jgi:hypothetical protein